MQSNTDYHVEISAGRVPRKNSQILTGFNENVKRNAEETIWDFGGVYTYLTADTTLYLTSSDNSDTQLFSISGMNDQFVEVTQFQTLTGQTPVALDTDLFRVFNIINVGTSELSGDVYVSSDAGDITNGVPDTDSNVKAFAPQARGSTDMALLTIPAGKAAYVTTFRALVAKGNSAKIIPITRAPGLAFTQGLPLFAYQQAWATEVTERFAVPEKIDLEFRAVAVDAPVAVSFSIGIIMEETTVMPVQTF